MRFNGKKVKIKGVYKNNKAGHLGGYNSSITDISLFERE